LSSISGRLCAVSRRVSTDPALRFLRGRLIRLLAQNESFSHSTEQRKAEARLSVAEHFTHRRLSYTEQRTGRSVTESDRLREKPRCPNHVVDACASR
jgi:hypothetical protein